jgi:hypothetical protein
MSILRFMLACITTLLLAVTEGSSQYNRRGPEGGQVDLNERFNRIADGKDVIIRSELNSTGQQLFDRLAERLGITNDEITREQFARSRTGKVGPPGAPVSAAQPAVRAAPGATTYSGESDADRNDLAVRSEESYRRWEPPSSAAGMPTSKPLVYHSFNLPKELPAWFQQLDTNHDAQIGLYEWKVSGRPIAEFQKMDRNNDGFLTVEEVLLYQAQHRQESSNAAPVVDRNRRSWARGTTR